MIVADILPGNIAVPHYILLQNRCPRRSLHELPTRQQHPLFLLCAAVAAVHTCLAATRGQCVVSAAANSHHKHPRHLYHALHPTTHSQRIHPHSTFSSSSCSRLFSSHSNVRAAATDVAALSDYLGANNARRVYQGSTTGRCCRNRQEQETAVVH